MAEPLPPKREVMQALLQQHDIVYVYFDPRLDGVVVPDHLRRQPNLVLQYGLRMRLPIPDLDVGEEGVSATLSFNRMPVYTFVPWTAVFAIVVRPDGKQEKGVLWQEDTPREVRAGQPEPAPKMPERAPLRAVSSVKAAPTEPSASKEADAVPSSERPSKPAPKVASHEEAPPPPPPSDAPPAPGKKKREIPPYLRLVK